MTVHHSVVVANTVLMYKLRKLRSHFIHGHAWRSSVTILSVRSCVRSCGTRAERAVCGRAVMRDARLCGLVCGQILGTPTKITVSIFLGRIFRFQQFLYRLEVTFENLLVQKASSHYHTTSGPLSASFSITSVVQYRCLGQYDRDSCCLDRAIHI